MLLRLIGSPALCPGPSGADCVLEHKDAGLLAVLALEGPSPRDRLAAWFWPEVPLKTAAGSLRQRVFRLRRRVGHELLAAGAMLRLHDDIRCDAAKWFNGATTDGGPWPSAELLAGIEWPGCTEATEWLRAQRERWHELRRRDWIAAVARHEASGDLGAALDRCLALLRDDPLSEPALRQLMRLHQLRGDRAAAVQAFEAFERLLKDELGTRPSDETVQALRAVEHGPAITLRRAVVPASLSRPPQMVARSADLQVLADAWAGSRRFLLLGEAGMGKTRLLTEFAHAHQPVLYAQARPGDDNLPYALWARLLHAAREHAPDVFEFDVAAAGALSAILPECAGTEPDSARRSAAGLQHALEGLLEGLAERGLRAWLVDDLHFADAASLEMLRSIVSAPRLEHLQWGLAQRNAAVSAPAHALRAALEDSQRAVVHVLAPLNVQGMRDLVECLGLAQLDAPALAEPLVRHCGGNPLFALETLKEIVLAQGAAPAQGMPRPAVVGTLIERRLRTVSPPALALARVAALAGTSFSVELAEQVLQSPALAWADAWAELEAAQVLQGGAFAHDLVHDAVRRGIPAEIARHVHGGIATFLEQRNAPAATCAQHWQAAQQWASAGRAWQAAARHALGVGRRDEEYRCLDQAADCLQAAGDDRQAFAARLAQLESMVAVRGGDTAVAAALALESAARTSAERAAAACRHGHVLLWTGRHGEAEQLVAPLLAAARGVAQQAPASRAVVVEAAIVAASAMAAQGRARDGAELLDAWAAQAEQLAGQELHLNFAGTRCMLLLYANRRRDSAHAAEHHIALARHARRLDELTEGLSNLSIAEIALGRVDDAIAHAQEARALAREQGDESAAHWIHESNLAFYLQAAGRYDEALATLEASLARLEAMLPGSQWVANAECFLAEIMLALGQPSRVLRRLQDTPAHYPRFLRAKRLWALAKVRAGLGQDGQALLDEALTLCVGDSDLPMRMVVRLERAPSLPPPQALVECDEVIRDADRSEAPLVELLARVVRLDGLRRAGRAAQATAEAVHVLPLIDLRRGPGVYPPAAWLACAQALEAGGDTRGAGQAATLARRWIEQTAMPHVPDAYRPSFLERQPVNRAVLLLERRLLAQRGAIE